MEQLLPRLRHVGHHLSRALPDARDGLKPVHRRILWSMFDHRPAPRPSRTRSAPRVVGDVIARYHPHGDGSIYDALARMAQPFSLRQHPDRLRTATTARRLTRRPPPATPSAGSTNLAMTMARGHRRGHGRFCLDNYSAASRTEPMVMPSRFPNLLVNGSQGIAVGMATNIPPHNLGEIVDATIHLMLATRGRRRRPDGARARARLSHRRADPRAQSAPREALTDWPWLGEAAGSSRDRRAP